MEDTEVEAAWTFVSSKRNRQPRKQQSKPVTLTDLNVTQPLKGSTADLSLTEIQSDHKKFRQQWLDSDCCHKLRNLLETKSICVTPAKAICLGLGSFDPEDGSWQIRRRSHIQLAAFRTLVDCLEGPSKQPIRCIFQEPCFTSGDKQFLESLGYEIVDSPKGFEEVSDDCLLFGVHLYRDIYSAAIEKATPAIFVGTGYDVWDRYDDLLLSPLVWTCVLISWLQLCRPKGLYMGKNERSARFV